LPYTVVIGRSAERQLKSLAPDVATRIGDRMRDLAEDPHPAQSKRLKGSPNFRLRMGDYLIIYSVVDEAEVVAIRAVVHRRDIYRRR
jgi:mRNA interferase RelE/StbE